MTFMADVDIACMASMVSVHTSHDLNVKPFVVVVVGFKSSRFGRLQNIKCAIPGKNLYMRFYCITGDAMGMNN
ncbi:hypothetical protein LWI28_018580 [Acer negundo]|uniref:Uncharacterized protein n=1 Tax=Acer negundo TaxID=4023 RepID=A0AAD5JJC1_ACENE|nr:hypothetical protein LWI28_018580 [Acer negundo]